MTEQSNLPVPARDTGITLGQQHLDASDLVLPRVKVVQQMSQEAADKKASPGEFFNTLTGENYSDSLPFVPILPFKQRVLLVRSDRRDAISDALGTELSEGDGLKCRSYDMVQGIGEPGIACEECPLAQWNGPKPPLCTETYNVAALTEDGDLIILSFSKSGAKTGKRLFSMIRMSTGAPWRRTYKATTSLQRNDQGNFYVPDVVVDPTAGAPAPELFRIAEQWNRTLGGQVIDVTPEDEEEVPTTAGKDF